MALQSPAVGHRWPATGAATGAGTIHPSPRMCPARLLAGSVVGAGIAGPRPSSRLQWPTSPGGLAPSRGGHLGQRDARCTAVSSGRGGSASGRTKAASKQAGKSSKAAANPTESTPTSSPSETSHKDPEGDDDADFLCGDEEGALHGGGKPRGDKEVETETIFRLERRGEGWAEEIIPSLVVEQRPIKTKAEDAKDQGRELSSRTTEREAHAFLCSIGIPREAVQDVAARATTWRVTSSGRQLVDRQRRSRVYKHMRSVVEELERCEVVRGDSMGALVRHVPQLLYCNMDVGWDKKLVQLAAYTHLNGNAERVKPGGYAEESGLGEWLDKQRGLNRSGRLGPDKIRRLEMVGFEFGSMTLEWEEMFDRILDYKLQHGTTRLPRDFEDTRLREWVQKQMVQERNGSLSAEARKRLDLIGFEWAELSEEWMNRFTQLQEYKREFGHCMVPRTYPANVKLGHWVNKQRQLWRMANMPPEKLKLLDGLDFEWDPAAVEWEKKFEELRAFQVVHGHCNVPRFMHGDRRLNRWLNTQRAMCREGQLSEERYERLKALGVEWDRSQVEWERFFGLLGDYSEAHGNCNVPRRWKGDPGLADWVYRQRQVYREGGMDAAKQARLESVGFEWDPQSALWEKRLAELVAFRLEYGHSNVPQRWAENKRLGEWVCRQRRMLRHGRLEGRRAKKLLEAGVEWLDNAEGEGGNLGTFDSMDSMDEEDDEEEEEEDVAVGAAAAAAAAAESDAADDEEEEEEEEEDGGEDPLTQEELASMIARVKSSPPPEAGAAGEGAGGGEEDGGEEVTGRRPRFMRGRGRRGAGGRTPRRSRAPAAGARPSGGVAACSMDEEEEEGEGEREREEEGEAVEERTTAMASTSGVGKGGRK